MNTIGTVATRLGSWRKTHRAELRLCLRVTSSGALTLLVSQLLHLRFPLWAVLTAVLLTQLNVGRSLKATIDYLAGTLGGAIFAGVVGTLVPHNNEIGLVVVLALALVPASLLAAENPRFSAASFTTVLVLLAPTITHLSPFASAFERVIEVAVGCIVGLVVSFAVFPTRASDAAIDAAARMLDLMASALPELLGGLARGVGEATISRILAEADQAYAELRAMATEDAHERMTRLSRDPDLSPLLLTIRRLRDQLVMMAGTAAVPLPDAVQTQLEPVLTRVNSATSAYFRASAAALAGHKPAPSRRALDTALAEHAAETAALHCQDPGQGVTVGVMARVFTLAFTLEQLRGISEDLERCIEEYSDVHSSRTGRR